MSINSYTELVRLIQEDILLYFHFPTGFWVKSDKYKLLDSPIPYTSYKEEKDNDCFILISKELYSFLIDEQENVNVTLKRKVLDVRSECFGMVLPHINDIQTLIYFLISFNHTRIGIFNTKILDSHINRVLNEISVNSESLKLKNTPTHDHFDLDVYYKISKNLYEFLNSRMPINKYNLIIVDGLYYINYLFCDLCILYNLFEDYENYWWHPRMKEVLSVYE